MVMPPYQVGFMSGLSLGICTPNLKNVALTALELLSYHITS